MKKIILKWLGLYREIEDFKVTLKIMHKEQAELLAVYQNVQEQITNETEGHMPDIENWEMHHLVQEAKHNAIVKWAHDHPTFRTHKVFHGGCLGCVTPLNKGIGACINCKYMEPNWSLPNLRTTA